MPRRILLLVTDLQIGGTPTVVRELASRLQQPPDVVIEVACLAGRGPVGEQLEAANIRVTALGAKNVLHLSRALRELVALIGRGRFDTVVSFLVHANTLAAAASLACPGVRFIQSIQTTQAHPAWHWWVQRAAKHAADCIVVPSASAAAAAREWAGVQESKIAIIPNAIEPDEFAASRIPAVNPRPYPVGFIGRLDPVKRIGDFLDAAGRLGDLVSAHLWGGGRESYPGETRATFHGTIRRPQEALEQIGLLVLPSAAEGFGLVLIEAMAAGVPVVATDVPGIRDVVQNEVTGLLVPVASPAALAGAMRRLIEDVSLRSRLIANAHAHVRSHYTWEIVLPQYRGLLQLPQSRIQNPESQIP